MKVFNALTDVAPVKVFVSLLLGTVAGIGYAFLIPIVINSLGTAGDLPTLDEGRVRVLGLEVSHFRFAALFFLSCVVIIATRTYSQLLLNWVAIDATAGLRIKYYHRILQAPIAKLEEVGSSRLIASITTDVKTIVQGAQKLPDLLISTVTVLGMLAYLLYLNSAIFGFVCLAIVFGAVTFQIPMLIGARFFARSRDKVDDLHEAIRGNIFGAKQLKLCARRRGEYVDEVLLAAEDDVASANKKGLTILRAAMNYGDMISFFVIGFVAFVFVNYRSVTPEELLGAIMVLLYITGPISVVMGTVPDVVSANISLAKVEKLFADLPEEHISADLRPLPAWQRLRFSDITYRHRGVEPDGSDGFAIGPVSFDVLKGQATFIVGGNGSGKSTLGKVITTHYAPASGEIRLDDVVLDAALMLGFRDQVTAITSDYYLFDRLFGAAREAELGLVQRYLERLQLQQKISLRGGRFSTLSLSDGQRKRLALLVSFLEDKQLYLFDEWAADQDPEFKKVFYYEILPYLKANGKAVVVISHDDRYFDVADRIFVMDGGHLAERSASAARGFGSALRKGALPLAWAGTLDENLA